MYKMPLADLKQKVLASSKITSAEFDTRIKAKINELSGLISEEGAAHIIANELGVDITPSQDKLKVKEIYAGMRSVSMVGQVMRKFEVREFNKGESKGRVCSVIIGDDTGTIRVVFWNDQVDTAIKLKEGDVLLIKDSYVKDNRGSAEVHLGDRAELSINPEGIVLPKVRSSAVGARKKIQDLAEGEDGAEILATIVQVFDPRFFYVCPECSRRVNDFEGKYKCETHGAVEPAVSYVMNLVVDDGSGNIRTVFWRNQVNTLLSKKEEEIASYKDDLTTFEEVKTDLLGEQLLLTGRVKRNEMFDRLEFNVQAVAKANPSAEIERLEKIEMESI